ncbi:hypothetical protein [Streptomyces litchfieldiae]|uniref:Uncharacterized protein n=1 Tax=Streptomyces litchfieldiae TaxID=3075543 RepID=A0ABU2N1J9_9ACTN|nr:hypothetical protein [Streptomyces sp. DSM 44938]MDT0347764.1 hypothetical protein [Streptomyces sp. DSM 44938]
MFDEVMNHFGPENITAVQAKWVPAMPSNLETFNSMVGVGMTPEMAAASTFTGRMAARYGFTEVGQISTEGPLGAFTNVEELFTRPS